ncbi:hypothetical protein [Rhizobium sp. BK491]|uniref:hypothetical protein n=1 Tax=Rhizobium sp. BK491 TaxID=2587009 RepID=UPI00160881F9|nr:hypothetical protein [Rhizobium sp. BK491]MBB3571985.1 hypothetical protein [Rhizobium sp. BK491]
MGFPQSSIEEIVESERLMVVNANHRYGKHYTHARGVSVFLTLCITAIDPDRMMFGRFFSQMKKHHMLALFSALRLHKVQAMMNLRIVLEAGASAAFAIANPERHHFVDTDEQGILDASQELTKKRYAWLDKNYEEQSQWIKNAKAQINSSAAHANIISADSVFRIGDAGDQISAPFFDIEDEYHVKTDLWLTASVAIGLMDLLYRVNQSRNVIEFRDNFSATFAQMTASNDALREEMTATDRYKKATEKVGPSKKR